MKTFNEKKASMLLIAAMVILMVTAILPIVGFNWPWLRYAYAAGAALTLLAQVLMPKPGNSLRVRRLARMNVWSAIIYCVSAACLFTTNQDMQNSWVAFLLAGAVLQIYATLMISHLIEKNNTRQ